MTSIAPALPQGGRRLYQALAKPNMWWSLGVADIRLRYRRSTLGPWWITISTGIFIAALGTLWSAIFATDPRSYIPYFAIGQVLWVFSSGQLSESVTAFTQFEGTIKSIPMPLAAFVLRLLTRQALILAHNAVIVAIVLWLWPSATLLGTLAALVGVAYVVVVTGFCSIAVAICCARFRDLGPVVNSVLTFLYFLSPIMWTTASLPQRYAFITWNPAYHLIEIVRAPLLTGGFPLESWLVALGFGIAAAALACALLGRYHHRVVFWL